MMRLMRSSVSPFDFWRSLSKASTPSMIDTSSGVTRISASPEQVMVRGFSVIVLSAACALGAAAMTIQSKTVLCMPARLASFGGSDRVQVEHEYVFYDPRPDK